MKLSTTWILEFCTGIYTALSREILEWIVYFYPTSDYHRQWKVGQIVSDICTHAMQINVHVNYNSENIKHDMVTICVT